MKIISMKRGFDADHSSSTYEFYALKPLKSKQREAVQGLTGESPKRRLHFHYVGDWSDIPYNWKDKLLTLGYDILVSESYDWWGVYLSLPDDPALRVQLEPYRTDSDGNGFDIEVVDERTILYFGMQLDYGAMYDMYGQNPFRGLTNLFKTVREELLAGDLSAVWPMYKTYGGYGDEDEPEPIEPLSDSADTLLRIMENY